MLKTLPLLLTLSLGSLSIQLVAADSRREEFNNAKRTAQATYTEAQRNKDVAKFNEAIGGLEVLAKKITSANSSLISKARMSSRKAASDQIAPLSAANEALSSFQAPSEMSVETIRSVDRFVRDIDKAIEVHHAASLNIR